MGSFPTETIWRTCPKGTFRNALLRDSGVGSGRAQKTILSFLSCGVFHVRDKGCGISTYRA